MKSSGRLQMKFLIRFFQIGNPVFIFYMRTPADQLSKSLLQKDMLAQCSVTELQQMADQYPYFGPAHLLMTEKLKSGDPVIYDNYLKKTLLYFNNPLWLQHLLNETGDAETVTPVKTINTDTPTLEKKMNLELPRNEKDEKQEDSEMPLLKPDLQDPVIPELTFEPFHTVDYFASQGIKFREEEKPTDRFGKQLKSFTDWLKTMKRIPETGQAAELPSHTDMKIENLAEHSIENRDVITEAMADVWEKQGNKEKAIAVYQKLSLNNPAKSTYFASKIDHLKKPI